MAKLINCVKCGTLFLQTKWDYCDKCFNEQVELLKNIIHFVENSETKPVHTDEIISHFNLSLKEFESYLSAGKFIKLGKDLVFNCTSCGDITTVENSFSFICPKCSNKIKNNVGSARTYKKIKSK